MSTAITVNQAVRFRVNELLAEKQMTLYRLEQNSGVSHSLLAWIMNDRNKNATLKTIILLAHGFGMSMNEFLNSPYFADERLDLE
jgi:transcriptional regulator with XRE-family HTH domain